MKRIFIKTIELATVVIAVVMSVVFAGALEVGKCVDCDAKSAGLVCSINEQYILEEIFDATPLTFEVVFTVGKDGLKETTTILGSDGSFYPAIAFTVNKSGQPQVMIRNKTHYSKKYTYTFNNVDVATEEKINLAVVMDFAGKKLHCYINGELAQTLTGIADIAVYKDKYKMVVGGDYNRSNATCFTGEIESVAMWSDMRTASEVASDYTNGVSSSDEMLLAYYDFTRCENCMVVDLSSNGINLEHVVLWQEKEKVEAAKDYKYSFAVVGDTQKMCANDPRAMSAVYDWILANEESQKIEYVIGLGDITDNSTDEEWEFSLDTIGKLNDKIPYILVRGNHDEWDDFNRHLHGGYYEKTLDGLMNSGEVNLSDPVGQPGVLKKVASDGTVSYITRLGDIPRGGVVKGDLTNSYQCEKIQGTDYIFITLDFAPNEAALKWVDSVLEAYPKHKAIIVTHAYMFHDGTTIGLGDSTPPSQYDGYTNAQNGEDIWKKCLVKHENVMLVLSGHDPWQHIVYRQDEGDNGNLVTQMLINPQGLDAYLGATGMVAMFYFSNDGESLTVRYYSVEKDCYGSELSQFTVHLNHNFKKVSEVKASCIGDGKTVEKCSCGKERITTTEKLGHKEIVVPARESTCSKTGLTAGKKCSVCGVVTLKQNVTEKKAHAYKTTVTPATSGADGKTVASCKDCGVQQSVEVISSIGSIKLDKTEYTYDKKVKTPKVTVKNSKKKALNEGVDYTVSYEKGRKSPGRYTVKIIFKGKYSGVKRLYFVIAPKATSKVIATQTTTTVTLKWKKVTGADGYRVYKYNTKTKKYERLKEVTGNSLKISKLKAGTKYRYKIRAYLKDGDVIWGTYSSVIETATKCETPKFKKLKAENSKVVYTWSDVSGESGYQVYYSDKKNGEYKKASSYKAGVVKGSKSKLKSGKTYYFKVRAYKKTSSGTIYSSWSAVKSVKVK